MKTEVFRMERVTYKEHEVTKLEDFNMHIFEGEILGMLPINFHGLSSFLQLLKTNCPLYDGYVYYNNNIVNSWRNVNYSNNKITIIQNTSSLVEGLTVADNIFVLRQGYRGEHIRANILEEQLRPFLEETGLEIGAHTLVGKLSVFERIVVELLKGIVASHKLIVLNEIETIVAGYELEQFHQIVRYYANKGYTFIYVCLHAEDIALLCDRALLLRNGRIQKVLEKQDLFLDKLISITKDYDGMIREYLHEKESQEEFMKECYEISYAFKNGKSSLNTEAKCGECLVIHCQDTQMYYEIKNAIIDNEFGDNMNLHQNKEIAIIQEKATETMIFSEMNYIDNLCFNLGSRMKGVWLKENIRNSVKVEYGKILGMDVFDKKIGDLSEKEKYSMIYYRILLQKPKIVFCIQPFQGADLDHRMHIWTLLEQLIKKGISVVVLVVNLSDMLSIADRLIQIDSQGLQREYERDEFGKIPIIAPWKHLY